MHGVRQAVFTACAGLLATDAPPGAVDGFPVGLYDPLLVASLKRLSEPKFTAQVKSLFQDVARFYGT